MYPNKDINMKIVKKFCNFYYSIPYINQFRINWILSDFRQELMQLSLEISLVTNAHQNRKGD